MRAKELLAIAPSKVMRSVKSGNAIAIEAAIELVTLNGVYCVRVVFYLISEQ